MARLLTGFGAYEEWSGLPVVVSDFYASGLAKADPEDPHPAPTILVAGGFALTGGGSDDLPPKI